MRTTHLLPTIFVLLLLLSGHAVGETLGDARVGFSAERLLVVDGRSYVGKMWHMPGEQRHEQQLPAINPVFILRSGSALADVVLPQLHTVVELGLPKEFALLGDPDLLRRPTGQETVNGIATTKYTIDETLPGGRIAGLLWLSRDGIPMKCDGKFEPKNGKRSTIYWELRDVKLASKTRRCSTCHEDTRNFRLRRPPPYSVCAWRRHLLAERLADAERQPASHPGDNHTAL